MELLISLRLPAVLENLEKLRKCVSDCARAQGFEKNTSEIKLRQR
jgi:hypothetical protein